MKHCILWVIWSQSLLSGDCLALLLWLCRVLRMSSMMLATYKCRCFAWVADQVLDSQCISWMLCGFGKTCTHPLKPKPKQTETHGVFCFTYKALFKYMIYPEKTIFSSQGPWEVLCHHYSTLCMSDSDFVSSCRYQGLHLSTECFIETLLMRFLVQLFLSRVAWCIYLLHAAIKRLKF